MAWVDRDPTRIFAEPRVIAERAADGTLRLRSSRSLDGYPRCLGDLLDHWAERAPERVFLADRRNDAPWRLLVYGEARARILRIAAGLLHCGLGPERPIVILSDNGIEHALLMFAAMYVGVPVASVSTSYSLASTDHEKLRAIIRTVEPGLVFADDEAAYARALDAVHKESPALQVVATCRNGSARQRLEDLQSNDCHSVLTANAAVGPDTIAKLLFTSGSTGEPKGVINTQRMLCSSQEARAQCWPFLAVQPPRMLDWLPWSHTFGGNHNLNMVLRHGGTLYIDGGRPVPGLFETTLRNLRDVSPTVYLNVPRGYDMLVSALRADSELRTAFFSNLQVIFYAAAALPQHLWEALRELASQTVGESVPMVSGWGSTETAPLVTDCHFQADRSGVIGVPVAGCELKLVTSGEKLEIRVRGSNVTPGYWKRPDLTRSQFDDEGFYRIGDAVQFVDPMYPERGLLFDGRVAEDFKLDSGTWVNVGILRVQAIAALAPVAQDIVLTGRDGPEIGFLVFPNLAGCRQLCPDLGPGVDSATLLRDSRIREHVALALSSMRKSGTGTSSYATRALFLTDPPSLDAGEITDKGYINQSAVLSRRSSAVQALHAAAPGSDVILIPHRDPSAAGVVTR